MIYLYWFCMSRIYNNRCVCAAICDQVGIVVQQHGYGYNLQICGGKFYKKSHLDLEIIIQAEGGVKESKINSCFLRGRYQSRITIFAMM